MPVEVSGRGPGPQRQAGVTPQRLGLRLLREPHPVLAAQQGFAESCARVLQVAGASGDRLTTALYLVLVRHTAVTEVDDRLGLHLRCAECRPDGRAPVEQYPCPTAQQAYWALDAVLR